MNVGTLSRRNVVTVRPFDELVEAARTMREQHVGYIVVVEPALDEGGWHPIGVLTDRDMVVAVIAHGADPAQLQVKDVMTRSPVVAREEETVPSALQQMRRIGVRRLPVVGSRGELVGVLSLDDVLDSIAGQLQDVTGSIHSEQAIEHALRS